MPQIHILPKSVYQLIAAGEVVERPASAIKEMVENSIDAGATRITVEIQHGGSTYMRITDDGCGIARADVPKVFISHATSKIATEEDLNAIGTLGFRGEAMASIGAVAQVELLTRTAEEQVGTRYVIAGGQEQSCDDAGCPVGTTVVVRDLFFNTPARMKFLKKDVTEGNAVAGVLDAVALSHPEIAFRLIRDGKQTLVTPGNKDLKSTVYSVFGRELTQSLIPVHYSYNGMELEGYVSSPHASRKSRAMQYFFINGRLVKSKTALAALEQAYKNSIMVGRFPACVLNMTVNAALVDVNVHPAKIEVRFANEKPVFDLVYYGVKTAIETGDSVKEATFGGTPTADEVGRAYPPAGSHSAKIDFFRKKEESVQTVLQTAPRTDFWQTAQAGVPYRTAPQGQIPVQRAAEQSAAPTAQEPAPVKVTEINALESQAAPVVQREQEVPAQAPPAVPTHESAESAASAPPSAETAPVKVTEINALESQAAPVVQREQEVPAQAPPAVPTHESAESAASAPPSAETAPAPTVQVVDEDQKAPAFRVVGEAFKTYILVEIENNLYYIDKHAAHERMNFEALRRNAEVHSQLLLAPVTVRLNKAELSAVEEHLDLLQKGGFEVEIFGTDAVLVRSVPAMLDGANIADLICEIAEKLLEHKTDIEPEKLDWIFHSTACRAAVKAGDVTSPAEQRLFVEKLLSMPDIRYCPHGRPVMIKVSRYEIERQFGRA